MLAIGPRFLSCNEHRALSKNSMIARKRLRPTILIGLTVDEMRGSVKLIDRRLVIKIFEGSLWEKW